VKIGVSKVQLQILVSRGQQEKAIMFTSPPSAATFEQMRRLSCRNPLFRKEIAAQQTNHENCSNAALFIVSDLPSKMVSYFSQSKNPSLYYNYPSLLTYVCKQFISSISFLIFDLLIINYDLSWLSKSYRSGVHLFLPIFVT
jgi:hypothetical protein